MSATKLHAAGYTDLVCVIPPGVELSENSKIKPTMLGKIPGRKGRGGKWYGYNFVKDKPPKPETMDRWGANIGMMGTTFPALDIDVDDEKLAGQIMDFAFDHFGRAPVRLSRHPRLLLPYRTEKPFPKVRLSWGEHAVECLGEGRQYVIHGTHPSGAEYQWEGAPLEEWNPLDIPLITPEQVEEFFDKLKTALEAQNVAVRLTGRTTPSADAPPQEDLEAPSLEELEALVAKIPNPVTNGWDDMIAMGYAIKAAGGGPRIFFDWCDRWAATNDPMTDNANWASFEGPYRAGWSWLCEQAGVSTAQDDFEVEPDAVAPEPRMVPSHVPLTDEAIVEVLLPHVRERACYVPGNARWHVWEDHRWVVDKRMRHEIIIRDLLKDEAVRLMAQGRAAKKEGAEKRAAARRFQSSSGISAVVKLIQARVAQDPTDFDVDPFVLNTPAGIIDLRTGGNEPTSSERMLSRATAVAPAPGVPVLWNKFMQDLTGGDAELARYVQKMAGYALTGDITEKVLWFIWGSDTDTGKSTFVRVVSELFGSYAQSVDVSAFINSVYGDGNNHGLAHLPGARLVTATEPAAGQAWDEKRIKAITGGDEMTARFLYGQFFTFYPQFKIIIVGNHEPEIKNVDNAMLRRIHIVPFNRRVPKAKIVPDLSNILIEREGPQILQWLIDGCLAWKEEGLAPPGAVLRKTQEYEDAEDTFGQWLAEECELGEGYSASRQSLYTAFSLWSKARGEHPGGLKTFRRMVEAKNLPVKNARIGPRRLRGYQGVKLSLADLGDV